MRLHPIVLLTASLAAFGVCKAKGFHRKSTHDAGTIMSLCFYEAFDAKHENRINEQEYVGYLTAHLRGTRHPSDDLDNKIFGERLRRRSSFTALFREFALSNRTLSAEGNQYILFLKQS